MVSFKSLSYETLKTLLKWSVKDFFVGVKILVIVYIKRSISIFGLVGACGNFVKYVFKIMSDMCQLLSYNLRRTNLYGKLGGRMTNYTF